MVTIKGNKFITSNIDNRWRHVRIIPSAVTHGIHRASVNGVACVIEITGLGWRVL